MSREYVSLGLENKNFPYNRLENLIEELPKHEPLYREIKNLEEVKSGRVSFYDSITERALMFTFFGELDDLGKVVRYMLEKSNPSILFSYKFMCEGNKSSKKAYKLAKRILTEEYGKKLHDLNSAGEPNMDVIMDPEKSGGKTK